ncbi:MAG: hypothetical protein M1820_008133 [Bogoriella megaspora]|nr:MAG: hypothetical protein M1820_008133 [Bogoriella megaspora]
MAEDTFHRFQAIPELLELVLLLLPPARILVCQRVCRTWKVTINHSPAVRRALWYQPSTAAHDAMIPENRTIKDIIIHPAFPENRNVGKDGRPCLYNPLMPYLGFHEDSTIVDLKQTAGSRPPPMLPSCRGRTPISPPDIMLPERHPYGRLWIGLKRRYAYDLDNKQYQIDATPGSWMTMLAVQPPARFITLTMETFWDPLGEEDGFNYIIGSSNREGLLLGELVDALCEIQGRLSRNVTKVFGYCRLDPSITCPAGCRGSESEEVRICRHCRAMDGEADVRITYAGSSWPRGTPILSLTRSSNRPEAFLYSPEGGSALQLTKKDESEKLDLRVQQRGEYGNVMLDQGIPNGRPRRRTWRKFPKISYPIVFPAWCIVQGGQVCYKNLRKRAKR